MKKHTRQVSVVFGLITQIVLILGGGSYAQEPPAVQPVVVTEPVATPAVSEKGPGLIDPAMLAVEVRGPNHSEINAQLRQRAAEYFAASEQKRRQLEQQALCMRAFHVHHK